MVLKMRAENAEQLDVVNPATGQVGSRADRAVVHLEGAWHQVFHCLVVCPSRQSVILQRRSETKAVFPGLLDLSVTGHLTAGEQILDGVREAKEELGIVVDPISLVPLGVRLLADDDGEGQNRERVHSFLFADDRTMDQYAPSTLEVSGLVEISVAALLQLLDHSGLAVPAISWTPGGAIEPVSIDANDLVPSIDGYWSVMAIMADRFIRGKSPLAI